MSHVQHCLDEIVAEISAKLDTDATAKALAAIEERAAVGNPVGLELAKERNALEAALLRHPYVQALDKIGELRALIAAAEAGETTVPERVIDLEARRKAAAVAPAAAATSRRSVRLVGGTVAAAAMIAATLALIPAMATGPVTGLMSAAGMCIAQF